MIFSLEKWKPMSINYINKCSLLIYLFYSLNETTQIYKNMWVGNKLIYVYARILCYAHSLQLFLTLCNHIDDSPPDSSVHGILQIRRQEWVAMPSSRGSSWPRDQTYIFRMSCIAATSQCVGFPQAQTHTLTRTTSNTATTHITPKMLILVIEARCIIFLFIWDPRKG